jgi:hypothetical protein
MSGYPIGRLFSRSVSDPRLYHGRRTRKADWLPSAGLFGEPNAKNWPALKAANLIQACPLLLLLRWRLHRWLLSLLLLPNLLPFSIVQTVFLCPFGKAA